MYVAMESGLKEYVYIYIHIHYIYIYIHILWIMGPNPLVVRYLDPLGEVAYRPR